MACDQGSVCYRSTAIHAVCIAFCIQRPLLTGKCEQDEQVAFPCVPMYAYLRERKGVKDGEEGVKLRKIAHSR